VFVDPKSSQVDIIQAVGRAIRLGGVGKTHGTIVVPIFIPQGKKEIANFDATNYKKIGDVLNALRAHDQEFGEEIDKLRGELGRRGSIEKMPDKLIWDLPTNVKSDFAEHIQAESIALASNTWEFMFGLLERFQMDFGHARPSTKDDYMGYPMGDWIVRQRQIYRAGDMTSERIERFESLGSTWTWDPATDDWDAKLLELRDYVKTYGTTRISTKSGPHLQLGRWVMKIRTAYNQGSLDPEKARIFESLSSDWTWDPKEDDWDEKLALLVKYQLREGHTSVPVTHIESGAKLGLWVFAQRGYYAGKRDRGSMPPERQAKLEAIPNWTWTPVDDELDSKFDLLKKFISENGTSRVPIDFEIDGENLGKWISHKREAYKKGKLDPIEIQRFESSAADWSWTPSADSWDEGFQKYLDYLKIYGSSRFPDVTVFEGFKVGTWISNQKSKYRQGKLSAEKILRLENSDPFWTWSKMESLWYEYYEELKQFVKINGHANAPYKVNGKKSNLGEWVAGQRKFYGKGRMDPERKILLDDLGFRWEPTDQWEQGFTDLLQFYVREGHARVHWKHIENERILGKWVSHQRAKYKNGELSTEQISRLEALNGWDWAPKPNSKSV
jgi:hypothetical protein